VHGLNNTEFAHSNVAVDYVDIAFATQNDLCNNIVKISIHFEEHSAFINGIKSGVHKSRRGE
jgi:hypothetical protein